MSCSGDQTSGNIWHTDLSKLSDLQPEKEEDSDVEMDEKRLEPRSDDDDTWVNSSSCSLDPLMCWDELAWYYDKIYLPRPPEVNINILLPMNTLWMEWASFVLSLMIITCLCCVWNCWLAIVIFYSNWSSSFITWTKLSCVKTGNIIFNTWKTQTAT